MSVTPVAGRYLRFESGGQLFALPLTEVREVVEAGQMVRVPLTPAAVVGLSNQRGRVYTVVDLVALTSGSPPATPALLVLLALPDRVLAVGADAVEGIGALDVKDAEGGSPVARLGDRAVTVLDAKTVVDLVDGAVGAKAGISRLREAP